MSKSKSQIGSSPAVRKQPPPLLPGPAFWTTPPVAKHLADDPPRPVDWLRLPTSKPDAATMERVLALRDELRKRLRVCGTRLGRRQLHSQLEHLARWLEKAKEFESLEIKAPTSRNGAAPATTEVCKPMLNVGLLSPRSTCDARRCGVASEPLLGALKSRLNAAPRSTEATSDAVDPSRETDGAHVASGARSSPDTLKKLVGKLKVRVDDLRREQRDRAARLADPAVYEDLTVREPLLAAYYAVQTKLEELEARWETETEYLESREPDELPQPPAVTGLLDRLGRRIAALRARRQLPLETIATRACLPPHTVSIIERGLKNGVSIETLAAIANAIGVTLSELFVDVDHPLPEGANGLGALLAGKPPASQQTILRGLAMMLDLADDR